MKAGLHVYERLLVSSRKRDLPLFVLVILAYNLDQILVV